MKNSIIILLLITTFSLITYDAVTYSGGPPTGQTNSPGEVNCTSCHGGTVNSGTAINNITLTTSTPLSSLLPNTTYTFTLSFSESGKTKYGFQLCVLPSGATSTSASIGTLTSTSSQTYTSTTTVPARTYLMHNSTGTAAPLNTKSWQFNYTTPSTITSTPVFYVSVNSANGDNSSSGDLIYSKTFTSSILPVKWGEVSIERRNKVNTLYWSTEMEINNNGFDIERSVDGYTWNKKGFVKSSGNSSIKRNYSFNDVVESGTMYYRIKQIDFNAIYSYSKVVSYDADLSVKIQPMYDLYNKSVVLPDLDWKNIRLIDLKGDELRLHNSSFNGHTHIDMQMHKQGLYILMAELNGKQYTWKIYAY